MRVVPVSLAERSYPIRIGSGILEQLGRECARLQLGNRCAVVSDSRVAPHYAEKALSSLRKEGFDPVLVTIPAGEPSKNLRQFERCLDQLAAHRLERRSFIVALGGGVVGDLAGFVAATYLRGIAFIQVPTTLLAQVDSSVGGKTGVNLKAGKNLVGAFYQPKLVLCDLGTFKTLPEREFRSGLAEVIKYGMIYDAALFRRLEQGMPKLLQREPGLLGGVIARCCAIKAEVVGQDETESGLRAILNFGHTVGHAIENTAGYGTYLHGEAVAIGMVAAAELSRDQLGLCPEVCQRLTRLIQAAGLPATLSLTAARRARLLDAMKLDKKVSAGEIKFVLIESLGTARWGQKVPAERLEHALNHLSPLRQAKSSP